MDTVTTSISDSSPQKPHSLWWLVALGVGSVVFSVSLFFWQTVHHTDQVSGKIVSIMDNSVMVVGVRGDVTALMITSITKIHIPPVDKTPGLTARPATNDITNLSIGQFIHAFGNVDTAGQFISEDIRVMKQRDVKASE